MLNVIAYEKRLQILAILAEHELTVTELAEKVDLKHAALSLHLGKLYEFGLVTRRREWKHIFYKCEISGIKELIETAIAVSGNSEAPGATRLPPRRPAVVRPGSGDGP